MIRTMQKKSTEAMARTMARAMANMHGRRHTKQGSCTATIQKTVHK
jgi:hypothetical protein